MNAARQSYEHFSSMGSDPMEPPPMETQGHRLRIGADCGGVELHQVIYGLNIPCDRLNGLAVKSSEGRMRLQPYAIEDRIWMMVFCFYAIAQEVVKPDAWKPFVCLKREVLNDLQAHAASQLNRIGNSLLNVKLP